MEIPQLLAPTLLFLSTLCGAAPFQEGNGRSARLPNVVVLFSDDAGYADFGFQPNCAADMKDLTPRIDSIAANGVRMTDAYMSGSVCSPSRAGLMTGRYQQRFGYDNNLPPGTKSGLSLEEEFGSKRIQSIGYTTGLIGKWHLGYPAAYHPNERGFDHFYGLLQGSRGYFPMEKPTPHRVILHNKTPTEETGYVTDRFGDAACRFIDENKDEPFYLFVSFTAPHSPNQPRTTDSERIAHIEKKRRRRYAGLIVALDDNVGKILDCLDANELEGNTLVIFTNDNGGQTQTGANNTPLKGRKGMLTEGGLRVPWAMRWPGRIAPGSVVSEPITARDILPTVFDVAGKVPDPTWKLDGTSFLTRVAGDLGAGPDATFGARPLFWRQGGSAGPRAMRLGKWKLHQDRSKDLAPALYDLESDMTESTNVAAKHPEVIASMVKAMDEWEAPMKEPLWGAGSKPSK